MAPTDIRAYPPACRQRGGPRCWQRGGPLAFLAALVLLVAFGPPLAAGEREVLLGDRLRSGWSVSGMRSLDVRVEGDLLAVRPTDRTRAFAAASVTAGPGAALDARACAYLTFEINTLGGATGAHKAPSLRIGVADAGGRSRQPVLARYLRLDADPATWQQALVPLSHILDRGVRAEAIASLSWQYAGTAAPYALRRIALVGGAREGIPDPNAPPNLLPDASFETRKDARPVWAPVGDYRDRSAPGEREIVRGSAAHGRRLLRLHGSRAYFFEALAPRADAVGFAVALRAPEGKPAAPSGPAGAALPAAPAVPSGPLGAALPTAPPAAPRPLGAGLLTAPPIRNVKSEIPNPQQVEIGCEVIGFGTAGGVATGGRTVTTVPLDAIWHRRAVSAVVHLEDMPPGEGELRLYRGWVRPLGPKAVVDVDAAQLAAVPLKEEGFQVARANALDAGTGVFRQVRALMGLHLLGDDVDRTDPARLQADLPPVSLPVEVCEWAGHPWSPGVVSGGIPLPRGRVFSPDALRLRGPDGAEVPFQFEVLRRDLRDGSVRCLWVTFKASIAAGRRARYTLETGATAASQEPPVASQAGDDILLHTGSFRARLSHRQFTLFGEAQWAGAVFTGEGGGIRLALLDGRVLSSLAAPSQVSIERNGPLHAAVVVRGFLAAEDERPAPRFRYEARLRAWRGLPGMQVNVAVTNLTPEPFTPVRSLALVVPLGRPRQAEAAIAKGDGAPVAAVVERGQLLRLTQRRDPFGAAREDLVLETPSAQPAVVPGRAGGWSQWQAGAGPPVFLAFAEMADRHPSALEVRPEAMAAYLIPPSGVRAFDFPLGLTAYGEFWVGSQEPPALALDRLQRPPLLVPDANQAAGSGVFQALAPASDVGKRFPLLDWILGREMSLGIGDRERAAETGWLNDGDSGAFGCWMHGETDALEGLYLHFLSTGDPLAWQRARRQALHLREVCTWWGNEESASQHPRSAGTHFGYRPNLESFWSTGLLYDYWLTGDRRSLDAAEGLGAEILSRTAYAHYGAWARGRILLHLAELYLATGRRVYRENLLHDLEHPLPGESDADTAGIGVTALGKALEALDRPEIRTRFARDLAALEAGLRRACPVQAITGARETYLFRGLCRAEAGEAGQPVWQAALDRVLWLFLAPHGRDLSLPRAAQALPRAAAAGAALPPWAAGHALGIAGFTGQDRVLTLRIHRSGSEPAGVTVCRMRAAHPDPSRRYRVHVEVRDPLRKLIEGGILEGDAFTARTFTLPRRGISGDYTLRLSCEEDGLAEVVAAFARVGLRADEWKIARHANTRARFFLRGPGRGEVRVAARGPIARGGDSLIAAVLRSPDGVVLGRARWSAALAGTGEDGRLPAREMPAEPLRLPVPAAYRGQPLALEVTVPRSVEWRVEGLDDPWLAATEEAFR